MQIKQSLKAQINVRGIIILAFSLLIMSLMFPVIWIEFYHPELSDSLNSLMSKLMEGLLILGFASTVLFSLLLFFHAWRHFTKNEKIKQSLRFVAGNLLNMIAAGIFDFLLVIL